MPLGLNLMYINNNYVVVKSGYATISRGDMIVSTDSLTRLDGKTASAHIFLQAILLYSEDLCVK